MIIRRNLPFNAALAWLVALAVDVVPADAGEKIIFSGRDGRQSRYHRSLNARPLFVAPRIEKRLGDGESPMDAFNVAPVVALEIRRPGKGAEDKDWIFKSTDELGSEGMEKELTGEEEEFEKDGVQRTSAERYLDRQREKRLAGDATKTEQQKISEKVRELDEDPLLAEMNANQLAGTKLMERKSAVDLAKEGRLGSVSQQAFSGKTGVFGGAPGSGSVGGKAIADYQREHINKLKQSLGVSQAIGVRSGGGGNPAAGPAGGDVNVSLAGASGSFGRPSGMPGAYPGSQGLGLKDLTSPTMRPGLAPLPGPTLDRSRSPATRERYRPSRLEQPKRKMF